MMFGRRESMRLGGVALYGKRKDLTGVTSHAESLSLRSNGARHDDLLDDTLIR